MKPEELKKYINGVEEDGIPITFYHIKSRKVIEINIFPKREEILKLLKKGIKVSIEIDDYYKFFKLIFNDCEICDCQGVGGGHPDFIIKKDDDETYIELKNGEDLLRMSQLRWAFRNDDKDVYILHLRKYKKEYFEPLSKMTKEEQIAEDKEVERVMGKYLPNSCGGENYND